MNAGACPWLLTHWFDCIRTSIQAETIGCMTATLWKLAQHFYVRRPLVRTTRMLLRCKPLLAASSECLSTCIVAHLFSLDKRKESGTSSPCVEHRGLRAALW